VTYVPARNTVFLALALGWAEVLGARDIFIGVNAVDYSGYPDCRPEFIRAFERTANLATSAAVERRGRFQIHAPLIEMTKAQIIQKETKLGVDYAITHSCYDPIDGLACGHCDACILRRRGFEAAALPLPGRRKRPLQLISPREFTDSHLSDVPTDPLIPPIRPLPSEPRLPALRIPAAVPDREHHDLIALDPVEDPVREATQLCSPHLAVHRLKATRHATNPLEASLHRAKKDLSPARPPCLVPIARIEKIDAGLGRQPEGKRHF
jgi:hypothetical protein